MKMKVRMVFLGYVFFALAQTAVFAGARKDTRSVPLTRIVRDSNGQNVEIPYEVTRAGPVIGAFAQMTEMLTAGEGKISAMVDISKYFQHVFPDTIKSNPRNYNSRSVEDLIASGTQVAYGPETIFSAEQREQLRSAGVAFVAINNIANVKGMCESFQIIGNILGEKESARAREFVDYYRGNITLAAERTAGVAPQDRIRFLSLVLVGGSYTTINARDISHEYIEAAGGLNVSKDYSGPSSGTTLSVDAEQILQWNPQVIMVSDRGSVREIMGDPALKTVDAVTSGKVYVCPYGIFRWSVRSGEGAMFPLWLGKTLYPDLFPDIDMKRVVKDFFNNYYTYDISADEIDQVLSGFDTRDLIRW